MHPRYLAIMLLLAGGNVTGASEASPYVHRSFEVHPEIFSFMPGEGVDSIQRHGTGMAAVGGTLGLGVRIDQKSYMVDLSPFLKDDRFGVTVKVKLKGDEPRTERFDLSTLQPKTYEIGKGEDGRVYQLNIAPRLNVIDSTPKRFDAELMRLHFWSFPDCSVLLNDTTYVGRVAGGRSPVAFLDICGTAKVVFSLREVKGWKPWGVLRNGVLTLSNPDDGVVIQINDVRNGEDQIALPGGPYRVWVAWSPSDYTIEEHREQLKALRDRVAAGELVTHEGALQYIEAQLARDPGPWVVSNGVRGFASDEIVAR
jgi:hypothetical protein